MACDPMRGWAGVGQGTLAACSKGCIGQSSQLVAKALAASPHYCHDLVAPFEALCQTALPYSPAILCQHYSLCTLLTSPCPPPHTHTPVPPDLQWPRRR
jgi:hypothetical protein